MIFSNMAYPGKDYRVQVFDAWLGETFEPMDNPKDGDKIVKRELVDGIPTVSETKVYSNGSWVDEGSGGSTDTVLFEGEITAEEQYGSWGAEFDLDATFPVTNDSREGMPEKVTVTFNGTTYADIPFDENMVEYGSEDFSDYPFFFAFSSHDGIYDTAWIVVENGGTYTIKMTANIDSGGGSSIIVEELQVTTNGTYTADDGKAYSPVVVDVPSGGISQGNNDDIRLTNYGISTDIVVKYIDADDLDRDGEHTGTYKIGVKQETKSGNMWTIYRNGYNISSTAVNPYPCFTLRVSNAYSLVPDSGNTDLWLMKDDGTYKYYACMKSGDYSFHLTQP